MKQQLQQWAAKYDALSERERIIVAALIATLLVLGWLQFVIEPLGKSKDALQSQIKTMQTQIDANGKQMMVLTAALKGDPNAGNKQRLENLLQQQAKLDEELKQKMHGLISPKQMAKVLETVLTQKTDLRLVRVQNLPTQPLLQVSQAEGQPTADAGVYRHGMQIEFTGSYLSTLEYLKALKALPWDFYWDGLTLSVNKYPKASVVITVHTLSLTEGWIGV